MRAIKRFCLFVVLQGLTLLFGIDSDLAKVELSHSMAEVYEGDPAVEIEAYGFDNWGFPTTIPSLKWDHSPLIGKVTAVDQKLIIEESNQGSYTITCSDEQSGLSTSTQFWVRPERQSTGIQITPSRVITQIRPQWHRIGFRSFSINENGEIEEIVSPLWNLSGSGIINPDGNFCTITPTGPGNYELTCSEGESGLSGSASLRFLPPPMLASINVTPANVSVKVGDPPLLLFAIGRDGFDQIQTLINPVWNVSVGASISPDGQSCLLTPEVSGNITLTCNDGHTETPITGSVSIQITDPPALASIEVTPMNVSVRVGDPPVNFTAGRRNNSGDWLNLPTALWNVSGGGAIESSGATCSFTPLTGGDVTLNCSDGPGGPTGSASIQITDPPALASIEVTPANVSVRVGDPPVNFTATGADQFGNQISIPVPTWILPESQLANLTPSGETCQLEALLSGQTTLNCLDIITSVTGSAEVTITSEAFVDGKKSGPLQFELTQNYPNPFNPTTVIPFAVEKSCIVNLKVYDMNGQEISVLANSMFQPGQYQVPFDATALASGIYFYRIRMGDYKNVKKMVLID